MVTKPFVNALKTIQGHCAINQPGMVLQRFVKEFKK